MKIEAASRRLPPAGAFSGFTAAWLHGIDVHPCDPIEVTVPTHITVSARAGMVVRCCSIGKSEVVTFEECAPPRSSEPFATCARA